MKVFIICMMLSSVSFAQNVLTSPATTANNTISTSAAGVVSLTVDNSGSLSSGEIAVNIKNTGSNSKPALNVNSSSWDAIDGLSIDGAGGYFVSTNFYAVMGSSYNYTSAWFSSGQSGNTAPTVVIQSVGGSADLLQVQDPVGTSLLTVNSDGLTFATKGLVLNTAGSKPACTSASRGQMFVTQGASGIADILQICMKNASNAYLWVTK